MKKVLFISIALVALTLVSCSKKEDAVAPKQYASFVSGQFIPNDGDITLKSAPLVGGHEFAIYKKATTWSLVDGSEFLPGSAPAIDWKSGTNPVWISGDVYVTYCPVLPLRVVLKATTGGAGTEVSYLGIHDVTPNAASFPIAVQDRRLGDVLTLNTDALTALPGYTNMSFDVVYTKSIIDVNQTALTSPVTTNAWPVYVYSSTTKVTTHLDATQLLGYRTVYDGLDAKITDTITINIHVDNTTISKTTPAVGMGSGLKITLSTTKVGWYNSGTISVSENDITVSAVTVSVDDQNL